MPSSISCCQRTTALLPSSTKERNFCWVAFILFRAVTLFHSLSVFFTCKPLSSYVLLPQFLVMDRTLTSSLSKSLRFILSFAFKSIVSWNPNLKKTTPFSQKSALGNYPQNDDFVCYELFLNSCLTCFLQESPQATHLVEVNRYVLQKTSLQENGSP